MYNEITEEKINYLLDKKWNINPEKIVKKVILANIPYGINNLSERKPFSLHLPYNTNGTLLKGSIYYCEYMHVIISQEDDVISVIISRSLTMEDGPLKSDTIHLSYTLEEFKNKFPESRYPIP